MKTVLAIIAVALIGLSLPAYADEVPFPVLPTDNWTGTDVKTFYPTNSSYIVQISVHYTVASPNDVIQEIYWSDETGQVYTIKLADEFSLEHFPEGETEEFVRPDTLTTEEIEKILDEKREEYETSEENGFSKLRACLEEFEIEQPVRFEAWKRTADLTEFVIPDQWINSDTYDRAELEAQKKWVICDMLKKYQFIGAYEANKSIEEGESYFSLNDTDSPDTVPVTEEAIRAEAEKAEKFSCTVQGQQRGLCMKEFSGINRGNPDGYSVPVWYNHWKELNAEETDTLKAVNAALVTQCDNYYPLYEHKVGTQYFPTWLEHCVQ